MYKGFQNPDQFIKNQRQVPNEQVLLLGISLIGMSQHSSGRNHNGQYGKVKRPGLHIAVRQCALLVWHRAQKGQGIRLQVKGKV